MSLRYDIGEIITAMVTPFNEKRAIDYPAVEDLTRHLMGSGSDSILIAGTTGESPTLTHEEEYELLYTVKSTVCGGAKLIMGAGSNCTRTAVDSRKRLKSWVRMLYCLLRRTITSRISPALLNTLVQ